MLKRHQIYLLLVLIPFNVWSQDIEGDFVLINKAYQKNDMFIDIQTKITENLNQTGESYLSNKKVLKRGNYRYSIQETIEYLKDSDYVLIIDHTEKKITLAKALWSDSSKVDMIDLSALSGAIEHTQKIKVEKEGSAKKYTINFGDYDLYKEIMLLVNNQHLITEMKLLSADGKASVEVYCSYNQPKKFTAKTLRDFFHYINGHYIPMEYLADYKFYNFYSNNKLKSDEK